MKKVGQGDLEILIRNGFSTFDPSDPKITRVSILPRMDMWTSYEEGRSRRSRDIDQKWF